MILSSLFFFFHFILSSPVVYSFPAGRPWTIPHIRYGRVDCWGIWLVDINVFPEEVFYSAAVLSLSMYIESHMRLEERESIGLALIPSYLSVAFFLST